MWERELFDHLVSHVEEERSLLGEYADAAEATESKAFAYVVGILNEDERRHHDLFAALAETVRTESELTGVEPRVPRMDFARTDTAKVRDLSSRLLRREEEDAKSLRRIHRQLRVVKHTTLWDLLIELMILDTDKHIAMLKFVLEHTPASRA